MSKQKKEINNNFDHKARMEIVNSVAGFIMNALPEDIKWKFVTGEMREETARFMNKLYAIAKNKPTAKEIE